MSSEFWILANLTGVRWNIRVVLICVFLMPDDVKDIIRCFSVIKNSSNENILFSSAPQFLIGLFDSLVSSFLTFLYTLDIRPLSDVE